VEKEEFVKNKSNVTKQIENERNIFYPQFK